MPPKFQTPFSARFPPIGRESGTVELEAVGRTKRSAVPAITRQLAELRFAWSGLQIQPKFLILSLHGIGHFLARASPATQEMRAKLAVVEKKESNEFFPQKATTLHRKTMSSPSTISRPELPG